MRRSICVLFSVFLIACFASYGQTVQWMTPGIKTINCPGFYYFYDMQLDTMTGPGGSTCNIASTKNYNDIADVTQTFITGNGSCIRDSFIAAPFNFLICAGDTLYVYDGPNVSAPLIRKMSAGAITTNFSTSGPAITFRFKTDAIINTSAKGWQMILKCTTCPSAPSNDDCANATTLTPGSTCSYVPGLINAPTNPAAATPACPGIPNTNDDVWYKFVANNSTDSIKVQSTGTMDAVVQLLSGSCGSLTSLQCSNSTGTGGLEKIIATGLTVGQTYYIRVFDFNGGGGLTTYNFNICVIGKANTDCAGATQFCSSVTYNGTFVMNSFGIQEYSPGTFGCMTFGESTSAWFYWQCQTPGTLGLNMSSSNGSYQDIDFALWGHLNSMTCPMSSQPIRCSYSGPFAGNSYGMPAYSTGLQAAETDVSEPAGYPAGNNSFVDTVNMKAGKYYLLLLNLWSGNQGYQLSFQLSNGATFNNCILPIQLLNFGGENIGQLNWLYWNTESEINNDHFVVERSTDGLNFTDLDSINAAVNSESPLSYDYYDRHPADGINYYRLRQVDLNNDYSYSNIILLEKLVVDHNVFIYPNPAKEIFNVDITSLHECRVTIEVLNWIGKQVHTSESQIHQGKNTLSVDMGSVQQGVYMIKIKVCDINQTVTSLVKI